MSVVHILLQMPVSRRDEHSATTNDTLLRKTTDLLPKAQCCLKENLPDTGLSINSPSNTPEKLQTHNSQSSVSTLVTAVAGEQKMIHLLLNRILI